MSAAARILPTIALFAVNVALVAIRHHTLQAKPPVPEKTTLAAAPPETIRSLDDLKIQTSVAGLPVPWRVSVPDKVKS
jgi:hypothetical protein